MPIYNNKEIKRVIDTIHSIDDIRFSFVYATDMHIDYADERENILNQCEIMVAIANQTPIDCILLGGDLLHGVSSREDSIADLQEYVTAFSKAKVPTYVTRGNHDDNGYHNDPWIGNYDNTKVPEKYIVWDTDWNQILLEPLARGHAVHDDRNPESTYYYVDDPGRRIRIIFLDAYAYPRIQDQEYTVWTAESWNRYSDPQLRWFAQTALDPSKEGWKYILSTHGSLIDGFVIGPCSNAWIVREMIEAFHHKRFYKHQELGIEADYSEAKAAMPFHIFGHTHRDGYHYDPKAKLWMINTANCKVGEYDCSHAAVDFCASPKRERGTLTQALFDVIVYTESGMIHRIRYGAGDDQRLGDRQ